MESCIFLVPPGSQPQGGTDGRMKKQHKKSCLMRPHSAIAKPAPKQFGRKHAIALFTQIKWSGCGRIICASFQLRFSIRWFDCSTDENPCQRYAKNPAPALAAGSGVSHYAPVFTAFSAARVKIMRPADVCKTVLTTTVITSPTWLRPFSTTTMVPSSR